MPENLIKSPYPTHDLWFFCSLCSVSDASVNEDAERLLWAPLKKKMTTIFLKKKRKGEKKRKKKGLKVCRRWFADLYSSVSLWSTFARYIQQMFWNVICYRAHGVSLRGFLFFFPTQLNQSLVLNRMSLSKNIFSFMKLWFLARGI